MDKKQFFKDINETLLEEIFLVQPDDVIEPDTKVEPGEEILSKMTQLEKCVYTVMVQKSKLAKEMLSDFKERIKTRLAIEEPSPEEMPEIIREVLDSLHEHTEKLFGLTTAHQLFKRLLFTTIESRLKISAMQDSGVRKGFVIVAMNEENRDKSADRVDDPKCEDCQFKPICDSLKEAKPGFCLN
jgi:hypothetical protein